MKKLVFSCLTLGTLAAVAVTQPTASAYSKYGDATAIASNVAIVDQSNED
jgi:hypothetical protein